MVCGVFPFQIWGPVGMQERRRHVSYVICLSWQEELSGGPWIDAHPEHRVGLGIPQWRLWDKAVPRVGAAEWLGFCEPWPGSLEKRGEEGMWLPEPPNKEDHQLCLLHPRVDISSQSNGPSYMVLKAARTSSELRGTVGNAYTNKSHSLYFFWYDF